MNKIINNLSNFIKSLRFRYSIVILLLFTLIFLVIFPSLNKSISEQHWSIINQCVGEIGVLLGFGIKHYFDKTGDK